MSSLGRAVWLGVAAIALLVGVGLLSASLLAPAATAGAANDHAPIDPTESLDRVHDTDVTGENVSVGVLDATGFDGDRPVYQDRVVATRTFGASGNGNDASPAHGTAAASVIARTAPDTELYLASFEADAGYRQAMAWLDAQGADVIVAPVTFYGKPDDGSGGIATATARAVENGTVVVAPTGNLARGHWSGRYDGVTDGALRFGDGRRNYLAGDSRALTLWLSWDRSHRDGNYTAELYRTNDTGATLITRSRPYGADATPNERIVTTLDPGRYYVVVDGPPTPTDAQITLESPTHRLQYRQAGGSIAAPATAPGVISVGAYDARDGSVAPYSSRGPTGDGRVGPDVVAPSSIAVEGEDTFVGTSASAAYVGGVSALLFERRPDATPREIERALERGAADVGPPDTDLRSGHGLLSPERAVDHLENGSGL